MKRKIKYFYALLFPLCVACHYSDDRLQLMNQSQYTITVAEAVPWSDTLVNSIDFNLRDTIGWMENKIFRQPSNYKKNGWSLRINGFKDKKLRLWIFKLDTLRKYEARYTINQLLKMNLFDTNIVCTEAQLKSMAWQLNYFGNEK